MEVERESCRGWIPRVGFQAHVCPEAPKLSVAAFPLGLGWGILLSAALTSLSELSLLLNTA